MTSTASKLAAWLYEPIGLVGGLAQLGACRLYATVTDRRAPLARAKARAQMGRYGKLLERAVR